MTVIHVNQRSIRKEQSGEKELKLKEKRQHVFQTTSKRFPLSLLPIKYTQQATSHHTMTSQKLKLHECTSGILHSTVI